MLDELQLRIRVADADDLDAVAVLWRESASTMDGAAREVPPLAAMRERMDLELAAGWELHVAALGSRVVGMLAMKPRDAWLDQIFVATTEQRKGIGKALLDAAKDRMPDGFRLRMAASNMRAGRFYEKEGLMRLGPGLHPRTGIAVTFYGWKVG